MNKLIPQSANFTVRKISTKQAVEILAKNNIEVNKSEAAIILDFLYHIAQNSNRHEVSENMNNPKEKSNLLET